MIQEEASLRQIIRLVKKNIYPQIKLKLHHNTQYSSEDLLDLCVHTGITHDFAENASNTIRLQKEKEKSPSADTLLYHLKKYSVHEVQKIFERCFDQMFKLAKSYTDLSRPLDVAIDLTDQLYYGKTTQMVVRTKYKQGTSKAYRFITLSIVVAGRRFTLLALPMSALTSKAEVVEILLRYAMKKLKIRFVFLDRGFFSIDTINLFRKFNLKFIMPARRTNRIKGIVSKIRPPSVIKYNLRQKDRNAEAPFNLAIVKNKDGKTVLFATNLEVVSDYAHKLLDLYRSRWGIETCFRLIRAFRALTTSKCYAIRFFYFQFSVCLYNLWVLANIILGFKLPCNRLLLKPILTAKMFGFLLCMYPFDNG